MSEAVFALQRIARTFVQGRDALTVLKRVDLSVQPGEIIALVGPSGAGKSTLLHIAGLLERPDAGEVVIAGQACEGLSDAARTALRRRKIGFVYQYHHLLPEFSALENVTLPQLIDAKAAARARERSRALLDALKLGERADHRPGQLSGGEQQRVAIARALANEPAVLLADEPTGNLDPDTAEAVFDMLIGLVRRAELTAIVATHNLTLAARMDRAMRLEHGLLEPA
jgi:lipoprotein-releasing system ATP-binding protein